MYSGFVDETGKMDGSGFVMCFGDSEKERQVYVIRHSMSYFRVNSLSYQGRVANDTSSPPQPALGEAIDVEKAGKVLQLLFLITRDQFGKRAWYFRRTMFLEPKCDSSSYGILPGFRKCMRRRARRPIMRSLS